MSPFNRIYFILFIAFSTDCISKCTFAAPVSNPYDSFIEYLVKSNCSMPKGVNLPFSEPSDDAPFSYLSNPLRECQTPDALKDSDEAKLLCNEIFEVLENITCVEYKTSLPEIQSERLSEDVCKDFKIKQIAFPIKDIYLSWRLVDPILCKFLCVTGKYDLLCETLLWSHDLQMKIKSAVQNTEGDYDLNKSDSVKKSSSSIKVNLVSNATHSLKQKNTTDSKADADIGGNVQPSEDTASTKKVLSKSSILEVATSNEKTSTVQIADKHESSTNNNQTGNSSMVINTTETPTGKKELKPNMEDLQARKPTEDLQGDPKSQEQNELHPAHVEPANKNDNDNSVDSHPETVAVETSNGVPKVENAKNSVVDNQQPLAGIEDTENNPLSGNDIDISVTKVSVFSENKNKESNLEKNVEDKEKSKSNVTISNGIADVNIQSNEKLDSVAPQGTEMDNELNKVNLDEQENESKVKESNLKTTDDGKKVENSALIDLEPPIGLGSETEAKPTESTTLELLPITEEEEHQEEKDSDQYNDTENEGDYAKSEYEMPENAFNPSLKNKDVDIKSSELDVPSQFAREDFYIRSRNNNGRMPEEGPNLSLEQEDGHFFFYFLSIVLILMAGYLIFHNKQKIIALIVEGRHERRRRSHASGYKKLETK